MKEYITSKNVVVINRGNDFALYNSIKSGSLMIIDKIALDCFYKFSKGIFIDFVLNEYKDENIRSDAEEIIKFFVDCGLLVEKDKNERLFLDFLKEKHIIDLSSGKKLKGIILEVTKKCNFKCKYCFSEYLSQESGRNRFENMNFDTAKQAINILVEYVVKSNEKEFEISFLGGEPLINFGLIKNSIDFANMLAGKHKLKSYFSITTNGSLVTKEISEYLAKKSVRVSVSLDGPKISNDVNRIFKNGNGAYNYIISGIKHLVEAEIEVSILTTLTDQNFDTVDSNFVDALVNIGVKNWGLNLEDMKLMLNKDLEMLADKLIYLCNYALIKGINSAGMWFKPIYNLIEEKISYCLASQGAFISIEPDGRIYSCSRTGLSIGTIDQFEKLFSSKEYKKFGSYIIGTINSKCEGCEIEGQCLGGCPAVNNLKKQSCISSGCDATLKSEQFCNLSKIIVKKVLQNPDLNFIS